MIGEDDSEPLNVSSTCMRQMSTSPERAVIATITSTGIRFSDTSPERDIIAIPSSSKSKFDLNQERQELLQLIQEAKERLTRIEQSRNKIANKPILSKLPKINKFLEENDEGYELFRENILNLLSRQLYTEEQKYKFYRVISGNARYTFQGHPEHKKRSFQESIQHLREIFACTTMHEWLEELEQLKHKV